jgi:hypothetical protein
MGVSTLRLRSEQIQERFLILGSQTILGSCACGLKPTALLGLESKSGAVVVS